MSRWTYLIPRAIIAGLLLLSVWLGRDPLIRHALVHRAQQITGAKVEIGQLRSSLENRKLFLKDIKIADPRDPMKNLLQAEMAYVQFDLPSLLHHQIVVEEGKIHELMLGVPRTQSGLLPGNAMPVVAAKTAPAESELNTDLEKFGQAWLDQIHPHDELPSNGALEVYQFRADDVAKWQNQIVVYHKQIGTLNAQIAAVQKSLKTKDVNPLRDPERFAQSKIELQKLCLETDAIRSQLTTLVESANTRKQQLILAGEHDQARLDTLNSIDQLDSEGVSRLLLHQSHEKQVKEIVEWFQWFRNSTPGTHFLPTQSGGGETIPLGDGESQPAIWIKNLSMEGEGRFAGQHLNFAGMAHNLSTEPHLLSEPVTFELKAQGNHHVNLTCEIDRRGSIPKDKLTIECPDLQWNANQLGHAKSLLVSVGPGSRMQARIDVQIVGETLTGELTFHYSNISLHVDQLNELAGGTDTALRLNQDLAHINHFQSTIKLNGTLDDFRYQLDSDIGTQFTETLAQVARQHHKQRVERKSREVSQFVTQRVEMLNSSIVLPVQNLSGELQQQIHRMANLREAFSSPENQSWPKIR